MVQDRRKYRRFNTSHPARLLVSGSTETDCRINNFSRGGLSLAIDNETLRAIRSEGRLDASRAVEAEVLLQSTEGAEEYRIPVRILFASDQGVGAVFMRPNQRVHDYLSRFAVIRKQGSVNSAPFKVLRQAQALLEQALVSRYDGFIKILTETFLELEDQSSQQEQPDLRYGR